MDYADRRIVSWIVHVCTHRRGDNPPCASVEHVLARNAALQAPHPADTIRRLYPIAKASIRNAELVMDRIGVIRELRAQGKHIPDDLNCRLCDLPGVQYCGDM